MRFMTIVVNFDVLDKKSAILVVIPFMYLMIRLNYCR